jgi:crossover junction endodeoxyribonuclease RusA
MDIESVSLGLPFPPSVNANWRPIRARTRKGMRARMILSDRARSYRDEVIDLCRIARPKKLGSQELEAILIIYPPDRRVRDVDNLSKAVFDALEHAGVYNNDSQIIRLTTVKGEIIKKGLMVVLLKPANHLEIGEFIEMQLKQNKYLSLLCKKSTGIKKENHYGT